MNPHLYIGYTIRYLDTWNSQKHRIILNIHTVGHSQLQSKSILYWLASRCTKTFHWTDRECWLATAKSLPLHSLLQKSWCWGEFYHILVRKKIICENSMFTQKTTTLSVWLSMSLDCDNLPSNWPRQPIRSKQIK